MNTKKVIQKVPVIRVEISVSNGVLLLRNKYVKILRTSENHIRGQRIKKKKNGFSPFLRTNGAEIFINYTRKFALLPGVTSVEH